MSDTIPHPTRLALVLAAERLIATKGLSGVSLREINTAAGQRNAAAVHYHFGSRDGIIQGVYEYRIPPIDRRRREILKEMERAGTLTDLRCLVRAIIVPLFETLKPLPEGNYYMRFNEKVNRERPESPLRSYGGTLAQSLRWTIDQIDRQQGDFSPFVRKFRRQFTFPQVASALASVETWLEQDKYRFSDLPLIAEILIDTIVAGQSAPVHENTAIQLQLADRVVTAPARRRKGAVRSR